LNKARELVGQDGIKQREIEYRSINRDTWGFV